MSKSNPLAVTSEWRRFLNTVSDPKFISDRQRAQFHREDYWDKLMVCYGNLDKKMLPRGLTTAFITQLSINSQMQKDYDWFYFERYEQLGYKRYHPRVILAFLRSGHINAEFMGAR